LRDFEHIILQSIIEFCYRGFVKIAPENALRLREVANEFSLKSLVCHAESVLQNEITAETVVPLLKESLHSSKFLTEKCIGFLAENFSKVKVNPKDAMDKETLLTLLHKMYKDMPVVK
jgi:hypothetical protein